MQKRLPKSAKAQIKTAPLLFLVFNWWIWPSASQGHYANHAKDG